MTDIRQVEREAAKDAEIERLRAQVNGFIEKGIHNLATVAAFQVNEELRAEIERLRKQVAVLKSENEGQRADNIQLRAEIARRALEPKP